MESRNQVSRMSCGDSSTTVQGRREMGDTSCYHSLKSTQLTSSARQGMLASIILMVFAIAIVPVESAAITNPLSCSLGQLVSHTRVLREVHTTTHERFRRERFSSPDATPANIHIQNLPTISNIPSPIARITSSSSQLFTLYLRDLLSFRSAFNQLWMDEILISTNPNVVNFKDAMGLIRTNLNHSVDCLRGVMIDLGVNNSDVYPNISEPVFDESELVNVISSRNLHVMSQFRHYIVPVLQDFVRFNQSQS